MKNKLILMMLLLASLGWSQEMSVGFPNNQPKWFVQAANAGPVFGGDWNPATWPKPGPVRIEVSADHGAMTCYSAIVPGYFFLFQMTDYVVGHDIVTGPSIVPSVKSKSMELKAFTATNAPVPPPQPAPVMAVARSVPAINIGKGSAALDLLAKRPARPTSYYFHVDANGKVIRHRGKPPVKP